MCGLLTIGYSVLVPLISCVCPLVNKFGLEVCASFLVGGTDAFHGWVNLGLVSLLVRAVSQGMFIGGFGSVQLKAACFGLIVVCLFVLFFSLDACTSFPCIHCPLSP